MNAGLTPSNALESATLLALPPGNYNTAVLSDVNGATGVRLIEVYNIKGSQ